MTERWLQFLPSFANKDTTDTKTCWTIGWPKNLFAWYPVLPASAYFTYTSDNFTMYSITNSVHIYIYIYICMYISVVGDFCLFVWFFFDRRVKWNTALAFSCIKSRSIQLNSLLTIIIFTGKIYTCSHSIVDNNNNSKSCECL